MADISTRFKAFLEADAAIARKVARRVHSGQVPASSLRPFIWFRRRSTVNYLTLDSAAGEQPKEFTFDLEVVAESQLVAKETAELVRTRCNAYRGMFADTTAQGIFVLEQDDDYLPRNEGGDKGFFVESFGIQVFTV